jgi:hypothetical protein
MTILERIADIENRTRQLKELLESDPYEILEPKEPQEEADLPENQN